MQCAVRGSGRARLARLYRRQRTDIPPVSARVTETRWHTVACACACACGAVTAAPVPAHVPDAPCYGPALAALALYLLVYVRHEAPRNRVEVEDLHRRAVAAA